MGASKLEYAAQMEEAAAKVGAEEVTATQGSGLPPFESAIVPPVESNVKLHFSSL